MPTCNPEDYMNTQAVEFLGTDTARQLTESPSAPQSSDPIFSIQEQLHAAQRAGNTAQVASLSMQLDTALQRLPQPSPEVPSEEQREEVKAEETSDEELIQSEIFQEINNTVGSEVADQVHNYMNENFSQEEIAEYMDMVDDNDQEAIGVFQAAQQVMQNEALAPSGGAVEAFNDDTSAELISRYGDLGEQLLSLNQQMLSGRISSADAKRLVLSNPELLRVAFDAKSNNLMSY